MKTSGIGGQAVMEGIMMKNGESYAVAVRKPNGKIVVKKDVDHSYAKHEKIRKIPFIRGIFNFVDSLVLGMNTLTYSAEFYDEDEKPGKLDKLLERYLGGFGEKFLMGMTVALSIILAIAIFMVVPFCVIRLLSSFVVSEILLTFLEGILRVGILLGYIGMISKLEDIQRVFMYHGAEHKCINCIEHGMALTTENVMKSSKQHKRCGTSFLLVVMLVSILVFMFIHVDANWLRIVLRIALVPVIAGISYEFIKIAGSSENKIINLLSKPGMLLQNMTTKEPDESMVEVAIEAVSAVFDWEEFLRHYGEQKSVAASDLSGKTDKEEIKKETKEETQVEISKKERVTEAFQEAQKVETVEEKIIDEKTIEVPEYSSRENPAKNTGLNSQVQPVANEDKQIMAPRITRVDDSTPGVMKLSWEKVKKASGYVVYRKTEDEVYKMYPDIKKNYFEDTEIEEGKAYYYRVRAYVEKKGVKTYGQISAIESNGYDGQIKSKY